MKLSDIEKEILLHVFETLRALFVSGILKRLTFSSKLSYASVWYNLEGHTFISP